MSHVLDQFEDMINSMLGINYKNNASFKVGKVLHKRLMELTNNGGQADFLFSNLRLVVSEEIYEENAEQINRLAEKMARVMVNMHRAFVDAFGETVANAVIVKSDMHFTLE